MTVRPGTTHPCLAAALLLAAVLVTACAETPQPPRTAPSAPFVEPVPPPSTPPVVPVPQGESPAPEEFLQLQSVPEEMHSLADRLTATFGDDPDFGPPEFGLDRSRLTVRWHGPVPDELQQVLDEYAHADFAVVVVPTAFPPGELTAEAGRLVREHAPVVSAAGARTEGDGVFLLVLPDAVAAAGGLQAALDAAGIGSRFPLFPEEGGVVPA